ncbi:MAG: helix-turn-helix domain-containing protein [Lactobacillus sp.]|nr:helix-turn-helix domain-containing protein [Lactobacillus sp.]
MNKIKELRQSKGLTQAELAKKVGISNQAIHYYENDKREPKNETWQKLADYFGTSVSYIRGDLDTEYLEKIVELLMLINFPNVCLKYRKNELNDSYKPFFTISITSQIIKLLGYDSREKFQEIYKKAMRLGDNPENSIEVKAYKEPFLKILTTSKEITNHLLKEYEKLEEKQK